LTKSANSFDLREMLGGLVDAVKERVTDAGVVSAAAKPDEHRIRAAVLSAVSLESKNAKEVAETISLASAGTFVPSSSALQIHINDLISEKAIVAKVEGDRKTYSITKSGKALLKADSKKFDDEPKTRAKRSTSLKFEPDFLISASKLAPVMLDIAQTATVEQQKAAALVLQETRHKLHTILAEK
jgi:DNA-binding PadR family transcriptional regulator